MQFVVPIINYHFNGELPRRRSFDDCLWVYLSHYDPTEPNSVVVRSGCLLDHLLPHAFLICIHRATLWQIAQSNQFTNGEECAFSSIIQCPSKMDVSTKNHNQDKQGVSTNNGPFKQNTPAWETNEHSYTHSQCMAYSDGMFELNKVVALHVGKYSRLRDVK